MTAIDVALCGPCSGLHIASARVRTSSGSWCDAILTDAAHSGSVILFWYYQPTNEEEYETQLRRDYHGCAHYGSTIWRVHRRPTTADDLRNQL